MKRRRVFIFALLIVLVAVVVWWLMQSPKESNRSTTQDKPTTPVAVSSAGTPISSLNEAEQKKKVLAQVTQAFGAPIAFYGKVIDQYGDAVPDASVGYTAADKFNASGSNYSGKSDSQGFFEISGIKGAGLLVGVEKQGYYPIDGKSSGSFAYGMGSDSYRQPAPTNDNPAIFVLHKMGEAESLIHVSSRQFDVPKTEQLLGIDLATGRTGKGNLQVELWISDSSQQPFGWRYRLSVPGGGLIERKDQFDFEAPAENYEPAIEINMPVDAEQWSSRLTKQYFAKLADGKYARFSIRFYAGGRNFVVLESYVNPKPGSRNLEFDPAKTVKKP